MVKCKCKILFNDCALLYGDHINGTYTRQILETKSIERANSKGIIMLSARQP